MPAASPARHNVAEGQDRDSSVFESSMLARLHAAAPPAGSVEVSTLPESSTAVQSELEAQETPKISRGSPVPASISVVVQWVASPVGSVEVSALPLLSTATQSDAEAQDTAVM